MDAKAILAFLEQIRANYLSDTPKACTLHALRQAWRRGWLDHRNTVLSNLPSADGLDFTLYRLIMTEATENIEGTTPSSEEDGSASEEEA